MISETEWVQFATDLYTFNTEVGQQTITWKYVTKNLSRYGEGETPTRVSRSLNCIVSYNAFRVWPITEETLSGNIDKQYCYLLLNNAYLTNKSWFNISRQSLEYNPGQDIFIINGREYEDSGDTPMSQAVALPLYSILILKRKTTDTGIIY